jgi:two-component system response regulator
MTKHVVLLVDDNPNDVTLTLQAFKSAHLNATTIVARSGIDALVFLLPADPNDQLHPAIVLLSTTMPTLTGLDVLHRLRADPSTTTLPVIMLTRSPDDRDTIASDDPGPTAYARKPLHASDILHAANSLGIFTLAPSRERTLDDRRSAPPPEPGPHQPRPD